MIRKPNRPTAPETAPETETEPEPETEPATETETEAEPEPETETEPPKAKRERERRKAPIVWCTMTASGALERVAGIPSASSEVGAKKAFRDWLRGLSPEEQEQTLGCAYFPIRVYPPVRPAMRTVTLSRMVLG